MNKTKKKALDIFAARWIVVVSFVYGDDDDLQVHFFPTEELAATAAQEKTLHYGDRAQVLTARVHHHYALNVVCSQPVDEALPKREREQ